MTGQGPRNLPGPRHRHRRPHRPRSPRTSTGRPSRTRQLDHPDRSRAGPAPARWGLPLAPAATRRPTTQTPTSYRENEHTRPTTPAQQRTTLGKSGCTYVDYERIAHRSMTAVVRARRPSPEHRGDAKPAAGTAEELSMPAGSPVPRAGSGPRGSERRSPPPRPVRTRPSSRPALATGP